MWNTGNHECSQLIPLYISLSVYHLEINTTLVYKTKYGKWESFGHLALFMVLEARAQIMPKIPAVPTILEEKAEHQL